MWKKRSKVKFYGFARLMFVSLKQNSEGGCHPLKPPPRVANILKKGGNQVPRNNILYHKLYETYTGSKTIHANWVIHVINERWLFSKLQLDKKSLLLQFWKYFKCLFTKRWKKESLFFLYEQTHYNFYFLTFLFHLIKNPQQENYMVLYCLKVQRVLNKNSMTT